MNFATLLGYNSGRATPSLRRTPIAHHNETRNLAEFHLLIARSCSDEPSQLSLLDGGVVVEPCPMVAGCSVVVTGAVASLGD